MPYTETTEQQEGLLAQRAAEAEAYLSAVADQADGKRQAAWALPAGTTAEQYPKLAAAHRRRLRAMLGYPPPGRRLRAAPKLQELGADEDGTWYRVTMPLLAEGLTAYGLLIRPRQPAAGRALAVAIHGGGGSPELAAELLGPTNYNNLGRRLARRGHVVWMPACLERTSFDPQAPPRDLHRILDQRARLVGTSLPALDALVMVETTRAMLAREGAPGGRALAVGLSYGGFRSLLVSALSDLFGACVSSCYVQDRREFLEAWSETGGFWDWFFPGCLRVATDVELAALVCPRPLFVELGRQDELFPPEKAERTIREIQDRYAALGVPERCGWDFFTGGHEFSGEKAWEWLEERGW